MSPSEAGPFLLGVNYPWLNYAQDFGQTASAYTGVALPTVQKKVEEDFAKIHACGVDVVRWFLFGDGRGGFKTEKGIPCCPDEALLQDVAAALQLAERSGLKLCFSLMDYLWMQDRDRSGGDAERERVLQFAAGREALLESVLIPLFREFRAHPALFAWEIANEPEWAIREFHRHPFAKMHFADFRAFSGEIVRAVHEYSKAPVTIGSARLMWVRAWSEMDLDFYQAHYYPSAESDRDVSLVDELASLRQLDKPLWLGELPARDSSSAGYSLENALNACRNDELLGAAIWRWTEPAATDADASIGRIEPTVLQAWLAAKRDRGLSV
jgi:hypothetical protein